MTVSLWMKQQREETACDVCVIGGGVVGVSMAVFLVRAGLDVLLLERRSIAEGASGRNAGYLMRGAADNYAVACDDCGRDGAHALWKLSEANLAMLRGAGVSSLASYHARPTCLLAYAEDEARELERSCALMREDGFDTEILRSGDDAVWRAHPPLLALTNPHDAVVNPVELVRHLAEGIAGRSVVGAEVMRVEADGDGVAVETRSRTLRCRSAVVCTNALARQLLPGEGASVHANRGQLLALDAPADSCRLDFAYYADRGSEYFRRADDRTVIVGGWRKHFETDERTESEMVSADVQSGLEAFAERVLGKRFGVRDRWAGTMGFTPDGLPIAGETSLPGVWVCAGFNGHGMSLGHATASIVAHQVATSLGCSPSMSDELPGEVAERVRGLLRPGRFAATADGFG
ncbi:MAG: FAD-binding oxidoreductase [Planctomycetota bacterium]